MQPQEKADTAVDFRGIIERGDLFRRKLPILGAVGVYRLYLVQSSPIRDEQGRITQWFGSATPVNEPPV